MIKVIGGTYREINIDTSSHNIFGSGLRSVSFLLENYKDEVEFYTVGNEHTDKHLNNYGSLYSNFKHTIESSKYLLTFKYYFATDEPRILPDPSAILDKPTLKVSDGNIICFGMLDGNFKINSEKVVYDPQTALNPIRFSLGSSAKELIYIVNQSEAKSISNSSKTEDILSFFFDEENVTALIIKDGPNGAKLHLDKNEFFSIPAYKTDNVFKIGSGDVFTTAFAFFWFSSELNLKECALSASKATANFCNSKSYKLKNLNFLDFDFEPLEVKDLNSKQVYIASPIFSLSDVILVDKIRNSLLSFGLKVFSPYHDVGYGNEKQITEMDIKGLEESDIIFSVLDGLDSGTLIELGYAMSVGKPIIGYHRTVDIDSLLMLKTADIQYYNELTTALYQVIWSL